MVIFFAYTCSWEKVFNLCGASPYENIASVTPHPCNLAPSRGNFGFVIEYFSFFSISHVLSQQWECERGNCDWKQQFLSNSQNLNFYWYTGFTQIHNDDWWLVKFGGNTADFVVFHQRLGEIIMVIFSHHCFVLY